MADADRQVRFDPQGLQGGDVVYMTPDQYLQLSPPMKANPVKDAKRKDLVESIERGESIRAPASLEIAVENGVGKVMAQDGRHRAEVAKEAGIKLIPVRVDKKGEGDFDRVVGLRGEEVPWDVKKPRKWAEITKEPRFRAMSVEDQDRARSAYFDQVIGPTLPAGVQREAKERWTAPKSRATTGTIDTDPTKDMSGFDTWRAGTGKAFVNTGQGVKQLFGGMSGEEVAEMRRRDAPLMDTAGGKAGDITGSMALFAPTAFIPGANTVTGSMTLGALAGLAQPTTSGQERFANTMGGMFMGGGTTLAGRSLPMVKDALLDAFTRSGQRRIALDSLTRFATDKDFLRKLNTQELVPGSRPTLAEASGDPGLAQLQRGAAAKMPEVASALAEQRTARLAARKEALATVAGTEGEREFFEAARDATADRLYKQAFKAGVAKLSPKKAEAVQAEIAELLQRPSMKKAVEDSYTLAKEEGIALTEDPKDMVRRLHYTKKALDRQIDQAMGKEGAIPPETLLKTKERLLGVIDKLSPKYAEARAEYAAGSKPINRMEIGQYLSEKLLPALNEFGTERYRPESFARALNEGDAMAKKATGFKGAKLADILTPEQTNTLKALAKDLGREAAAQERAKVPGSPTAQYLAAENMLEKIAGPLGLPKSWVSNTLSETFTKYATKFPLGRAEERIGSELAEFITNPEAARAAAAARKPLAVPFGDKRVPLSDIGKLLLPPVSTGSAAYATQ